MSQGDTKCGTTIINDLWRLRIPKKKIKTNDWVTLAFIFYRFSFKGSQVTLGADPGCTSADLQTGSGVLTIATEHCPLLVCSTSKKEIQQPPSRTCSFPFPLSLAELLLCRAARDRIEKVGGGLEVGGVFSFILCRLY